MIKKLQALKAKKGFTLVELIVVIAIIGVLAAILIPTMLGYVTSSRVTSANQTAASMKNEADSWLTKLDTASKGMKKDASINNTVTVEIDATGGWTATGFVNTNFNGGVTAADLKTDFETKLADLFPEIKSAAATFYLQGGKCVAVAFSTDASTTTDLNQNISFTYNTTIATSDWGTSAWSNTEGVDTAGNIIGTAPVLKTDIGTATS